MGKLKFELIINAIISGRIEELNLSSPFPENRLNSIQIRELALALMHPNNRVTSLRLSHNNFSDKDFGLLLSVLQHKNNHLELLGLSHNNLNDARVAALMVALRHKNNRIQTLTLSGNPLGVAGLNALALGLSHEDNHIQTLNLSAINLNVEGMKALSAELCREGNRILTLNLANNNLGVEAVSVLANILKHKNNRLQSLDLSLNTLGGAGIKALAEGLSQENNQLKILNIATAHLSADDMPILISALQAANSQLHTLDVSTNSLRDEGVILLMSVLRREHNNIQTLNLAGTHFGIGGIDSLTATLQDKNNRLHTLDLTGNHLVFADSLVALSSALRHVNNHIHTLILAMTHFNHDGFSALAVALKDKNNRVKKLDVSGNALFGSFDIRLLTDALQHENNHIEILNLSGNNLGSKNMIALQIALQHRHCKIKLLDIGGPQKIKAEDTVDLVSAFQPYVETLIIDAAYLEQAINIAPLLKVLKQENNLIQLKFSGFSSVLTDRTFKRKLIFETRLLEHEKQNRTSQVLVKTSLQEVGVILDLINIINEYRHGVFPLPLNKMGSTTMLPKDSKQAAELAATRNRSSLPSHVLPTLSVNSSNRALVSLSSSSHLSDSLSVETKMGVERKSAFEQAQLLAEKMKFAFNFCQIQATSLHQHLSAINSSNGTLVSLSANSPSRGESNTETKHSNERKSILEHRMVLTLADFEAIDESHGSLSFSGRPSAPSLETKGSEKRETGSPVIVHQYSSSRSDINRDTRQAEGTSERTEVSTDVPGEANTSSNSMVLGQASSVRSGSDGNNGPRRKPCRCVIL